MLLDCPACARSYHVSRDEIGDHGRTVVCPRCRAQWFVDGEGHGQTALDDLTTTAISTRIDPDAGDRLPPPPSFSPSFARRAGPFTAAVAGVVCLMALIGARDQVVRLVPRMARLYAVASLPVNVRGLEFTNVAPIRLAESTRDMTIAGEIRNITNRRVRVPRVAYEIRDAAGTPLAVWSEPVPAKTLRPGQVLAFLSRPHDVPADAQTVLVHFQSDDGSLTEAQVDR